MVFFNHATRQMTAKIVYYGPGLCGKTTNLNTIYGKTSQKARGEMVSLNTETDRTLFFDLLPMDVGMVGGFKTKLQLYTVPGQVFYNSTRKLVLKGVDGIVFVVDSQVPMLDACRESWQNLEENLRELGLDLHSIPLVFQWNKRDLKNLVPVDELEQVFNPRGLPSFQAVASDGTGVFETLRGVTRLALTQIKNHVLGEAPVPAPAQAEPIPAASTPPLEPQRAGEALTLSDLPTVTDLLDMEPPPATGSHLDPLPDEDDAGLFIEAPALPEPPAGLDELSFLEELDEIPPPAFAEEVSAPEAAEPPAPVEPPPVERGPQAAELAPEPVRSTPRPGVPRVDPLAALAALKVEARKPAPRPKAADSKDAISSLLGELTQVGRSGAASVLRLEVPSEADGQEIEVVVQLRCQGQTLAEGQVKRQAPGKGSTAKLSVELKRS